MTKDLATVETQPLATSEGERFLSFLERVCSDPNFDAGKMKEILAMRDAQLAQERKRAFFVALSALQAELAPIAKSGENQHTRSRYVRLDDLLIVLRPLLEKHGFAFSFDSKPAGKDTEFSCELMHVDGHAETKRLVLPPDGVGSQGGRSSMNALQAVGSATSYARRYLIDMHLNLARRDEDDDGSGGPKPITQDQADYLRKAVTDANGDEVAFLKLMHATSFEGILASDYGKADAAVRAKARRVAR